MPLLLVDLDNTLVDRAGAFDRWAREFTSEPGGASAGGVGGAGDAEWLVAGLLAELRGGLVRQLVADAAVTRALRDARAAGWVPFVVTNGTVEQQERKLRHTGLDREVAGWVISEGAGLRKPDPAIFQLAAARAGQPLDGAWMIGDSAEADINGARNAGLLGIWLHRGRPWPLTTCQPAYVADSFPHAVDILLGLGGWAAVRGQGLHFPAARHCGIYRTFP